MGHKHVGDYIAWATAAVMVISHQAVEYMQAIGPYMDFAIDLLTIASISIAILLGWKRLKERPKEER